MSKTLTVNIEFLEQPLDGDKFGYKIFKNGTIYENTDKTFIDGNTYLAGKIFLTEDDLEPANVFGLFNGTVRDIYVDGDTYLVVGDFTTYTSPLGVVTTCNRIIRLLNTGERDTSFALYLGGPQGSNFDAAAYCIEKMSGFYYVGGDFTKYGGIDINGLVKINATNGIPDFAFCINAMSAASNKGFNSTVRDVTALSNVIYAVGDFTIFNNVNQTRITGINPNGTRFLSFSGSLNARPEVIKTHNNFLYVAGNFTQYNSSPANRIVSITSTGNFNNTFVYGTGFNGLVKCLTFDSGFVYAGGSFTTYNGTTAQRIVKINSTNGAVSDVLGDITFGGSVNSIVAVGTSLVLGGDFFSYNSNDVGNVIKISSSNGTLEEEFDFDSAVLVMALSGSNIVYGGQFNTATYTGSANQTLLTIPIGVDVDETQSNTYDNLPVFNSNTGFVYTSVGVSVILTYTFDDDDIVLINDIFDTPGRVVITFINESLTINEIIEDVLVRSPKFTKVTGTNFNETTFSIKAYEGNLLEGDTQPIIYQKTKQKLVNSQEKIYLNVSPLTKEKLEASPIEFLNTDLLNTLPMAPGSSKWVEVDYENMFNGDLVDTGFYYYFILDGYLNAFEDQHIPRILLTGNKRYINKSQKQRIYFKANFLQSIEVRFYVNGQVEETLFPSFNQNIFENTNYIQSLPVFTESDELIEAGITDVDRIQYVFTYDNEVLTVDYFVYNDCLYDYYDIIFKNKYGVLETLPMSKKSTKTLEVKDNTFLRSIVDFNGDFDPIRHTTTKFNVSGEEMISLNTDFLPEYMNESIREMMLSEEVWLLKGFDIIPVVKENQDLQFKTRLNDMLIQYNISVKFSHNSIKNIQ
jgi:hypothetical protein